MIKWSDKFDGIICLHYLPYKERFSTSTEQFNRVGILDSGIFRYYFTFPNPMQDLIKKNMKVAQGLHFQYFLERVKHVFQCVYAHYCIMKQSLGMDMERVLILQDDIKFLKDLDLLENLISTIPDQADVIRGQVFDSCPAKMRMHEKYGQMLNQNYMLLKGYYVGAGCYAVNKKFMQGFTQIFEQNFVILDLVFHLLTNITMAVPKIRWAIQGLQHNPEKIESVIRNYENANNDISRYI